MQISIEVIAYFAFSSSKFSCNCLLYSLHVYFVNYLIMDGRRIHLILSLTSSTGCLGFFAADLEKKSFNDDWPLQGKLRFICRYVYVSYNHDSEFQKLQGIYTCTVQVQTSKGVATCNIQLTYTRRDLHHGIRYVPVLIVRRIIPVLLSCTSTVCRLKEQILGGRSPPPLC